MAFISGFPLQPLKFSSAGSSVAQPRAAVRIFPGGSVKPITLNVISFRIEKTVHGVANTASFVVSYAGNPDWTRALLRGEAGVPDDLPIYVEIWAGFPSNPGSSPNTGGLSRRFYGVVDVYDTKDADEVEFHCRSIAAPLCTDKILSSVQNLTTVQFIQQIGKQYGMPVYVDPELTEPFTLARVYGQDFVVGLHDMYKWDVLVRSAQCDDVDLWEDQGVLFYVHPWNVDREKLELHYGSNVLGFQGHHSPQFNRNVQVFVHSYSDKIRTSITTRVQNIIGSVVPGVNVSQAIKVSYASPQWGTNNVTTKSYYSNGDTSTTQSSTSGGSASGSTVSSRAISDSGKERYEFYLPNLTSAECDRLAKAIWRQISMHEYQADISLAITPAILEKVDITSLIDFTGYGMTRFNTKYWARTMSESFAGAEPGSPDSEGWTVDFHVVNHAPPIND
jgi:hypothetical protein